MGKNSKDSNLIWQIRNNVRKNNFKAVADTVKNVIHMDEENPEKEQLMKKIYIDVIEPWVRGANVEQEVPRQYEEMFIEFARQLDESSEQEKILNMLKRIENSNIQEVILATNPTIDGETTALYISKLLEKFENLKVTRLAYGLPMGANLDFTDELTLSRAIEGRTSYKK